MYIQLTMLLYEVVDTFESVNLKYALVGGYALALQGIVRATIDIDLILSLNHKDFELAEASLEKIGLRSRLPVRASDIINMRMEYIKNRNLIAWSFIDYNTPSRQVDILITKDLRRVKTRKVSVGKRKICVATLNELLKMKLASGRPQDLVDANNIKEKLKSEN